MALLKRSDLEYKYSWTVCGDDDPKVTGKPDNTELNRNEGYEMLYFINKYAADNDIRAEELGIHIEYLIHEKIPALRSHKEIRDWLTEFFKSNDK